MPKTPWRLVNIWIDKSFRAKEKQREKEGEREGERSCVTSLHSQAGERNSQRSLKRYAGSWSSNQNTLSPLGHKT